MFIVTPTNFRVSQCKITSRGNSSSTKLSPRYIFIALLLLYSNSRVSKHRVQVHTCMRLLCARMQMFFVRREKEPERKMFGLSLYAALFFLFFDRLRAHAWRTNKKVCFYQNARALSRSLRNCCTQHHLFWKKKEKKKRQTQQSRTNLTKAIERKCRTMKITSSGFRNSRREVSLS